MCAVVPMRVRGGGDSCLIVRADLQRVHEWLRRDALGYEHSRLCSLTNPKYLAGVMVLEGDHVNTVGI